MKHVNASYNNNAYSLIASYKKKEKKKKKKTAVNVFNVS
jgi:hypothetical protein